MAGHRRTQPEVLERGDIFFLYRPAVDQDEPRGLLDVQRFFVVLKPDGDEKFRLLIVGRKRLPDVETHERFWGFVDRIERSATSLEQELRSLTYGTATRGERHAPAARPAGEGVYSITLLGGQMHLSYMLELPKHPAEVQEAFHIVPQASFALSVKNPEASTPPGVGLREHDKADYPDRLQAEFGDRRFEREDVRMLDYPGAEFILVGASAHPGEAHGPELSAGEKDRFPDIFRELHLRRADHPVKPLFEGKWE